MATTIRGVCPHCGMEGGTQSEMDKVLMARRVCEGCGKDLVVNGTPMKPEDYKPDSAA